MIKLLQERGMQIRTFEGQTPQEAFKKAKDALGPDAYLIHCYYQEGLKPFYKGKYIITAATGIKIVKDFHPASKVNIGQEKLKMAYRKSPPGVKNRMLCNELTKIRSIIDEIERKIQSKKQLGKNKYLFDEYLRLIGNHVSESIAEKIVRKLQDELSEEELKDTQTIRFAIKDVLRRIIRCSDGIDLIPGRCAKVVFVGPTGDGKTTTIGKLIAIYSSKYHKRVAVIAADYYRVGAIEQITNIVEQLSIPVRTVFRPAQLQKYVHEFRDFDILFVDTPGRSPADKQRMEELNQIIQIVEPDEVHLVVSISRNPKSIESCLRRYLNLKQIDKLVLTKFDEHEKYGLILDVICHVNRKISYITKGQRIPKDIEVADSERLVKLCLGEEWI
jgi:flagellar biosynthesis protein FlhF